MTKRKRVQQFGVRDDFATADQLSERAEGRYDPRPASGARVRTLVKVRCARCGDLICTVDLFEKRPLVHHVQEKWWQRNFKSLRCACMPEGNYPVDGEQLTKALIGAIDKGRTLTFKAGQGRSSALPDLTAGQYDLEKSRAIIAFLDSLDS